MRNFFSNHSNLLKKCNKLSNGNNIHGETVDGTCGSLAGETFLSDGAARTNTEKQENT